MALLQQRFNRAIMDPQFQWVYLNEFVRTKQPLPPIIDAVCYEEMCRAYRYVTEDTDDEELHEVMVFRDPDNHRIRGCIEASLLCKTADLDAIAKAWSIPIRVLEIYSQLFFDVRDRLTDQVFYAKVVCPEGRIVEMQHDFLVQASPERILKIAIPAGLTTIVTLAGAFSQGMSNMAALKEQMELRGMEDAVLATILGGFNLKDSPAIRNARALIIADKEGGGGSGGASTIRDVGIEGLDMNPGTMSPGHSIEYAVSITPDQTKSLPQAAMLADVKKQLEARPAPKPSK